MGRWLILAALTLVLLLRGAISLRGYLYADDFAFRYWAATEPLDWSYLSRSYGGHVNPIGLLNQWILQALFPGSHTALALFTVLLWAATLVVAASLAWRLTLRWQGPVLLVSVLGVSLFAFENTTWWAAAIYAGPYQLFLVCGAYAISRYILTGSRRWAWVAVVCSVAASFSFSRGFMAAVLIFILASCIPWSSDGAAGARASWARDKLIWSIMAGGAALALLLVFTSSAGIARAGFSVLKLPGYMWKLCIYNVFPAIWGGPWRWFELPPPQWAPIVANPAPATWAVWLFTVLTASAALWIWARRSHLRALLLGASVFALVVLVIAGLARSGTAVESVAYRYTFDILWPVAVLMVLSVVPMRWQEDRTSAPGTAVVGLVIVSALVSTVVPARDWIGNESAKYMANAVAGFQQIPAGQLVLNQGVPNDLIHPALMAPYANAQVVFTPQPGAPTFADYAADTLWGFAPDGRVEIQDVTGPTSRPGPDPDCGYRVTDTPRTIPLNGKLIAWDFYARVAYFSGAETTLNLAVGGQIHTVPLRADGVRAVYFPVSGPGSDVLVSVGTPGATVCLTEVRIGNRVSSESGELVTLPVTRLAR